MTCIIGANISICGNFAKLSKKKPKTFDKEYKCIVEYPFKWRAKLGKVECNCVECEEHFQPYYGWTWFHDKDCAIMNHLKKFPQIESLVSYDIRVITYSD